jgi:hypothetical protein
VDKEEKARKTREYNQKRKLTHPQERRDCNRRRRNERVAWLRDYKSGLSCILCGFSHPDALDFHHRDPAQKEMEVSKTTRGWSIERIKKEIDKCDVLCANCHRILHATR